MRETYSEKGDRGEGQMRFGGYLETDFVRICTTGQVEYFPLCHRVKLFYWILLLRRDYILSWPNNDCYWTSGSVSIG